MSVVLSQNKRNLNIDGIDVLMPREVYKFLEYEDIVVVLLEQWDKAQETPEYREQARRNVHAYSRNGKHLWQIAFPEKNIGAEEPTSVMNIYIEDGRLMASHWVGVSFQVDPKSGAVKLYPPHQRPW